MLFNSYAFLMLFLPITFLVYFGLNRCGCYRAASVALLSASFIFYGYENWRLCLLLAASIGINYLFHAALTEGRINIVWYRKLLLFCGLAVNLGILFYFKYLNFFLTNVNKLTGSSFLLKNVVLPLGISFYTFQQVSFVVDSYRGEMRQYPFWEYALFVSFFPQLVAGPIVLHREMIPQFTDPEKRRINYANLFSGVEYLILGLAKKMLLADSFSKICDVCCESGGYSVIVSLDSLSAAAVILSYTLEIYFDFSGYCDMAIGIGRLFNFEIPINFRSPYKAINIADFWKRWHITLTRFLTTYLYIPLGGNRGSKWKTYRNVLIVFTLSGLWHGADWHFVIWGMLHGVMMVFYRTNQTWIDRLPKWLTWFLTFGFVNAAWMFFWLESEKMPLRLFSRLFCGGLGNTWTTLSQGFCEDSFFVSFVMMFAGAETVQAVSQIYMLIWLCAGLLICVAAPSTHEIVAKKHRNQIYYLGLAVLFFAAVVHLSGVSKFIYFNF